MQDSGRSGTRKATRSLDSVRDRSIVGPMQTMTGFKAIGQFGWIYLAVVLDIHGTISHIIGAYGSYPAAKVGCEAAKMTLNYGERRTIQAVEVKG